MRVIWHDVECGSYRADIGLWLELAAREAGPILDVGAGTGRVAIPLHRAGHEVVALDLDGELLSVLRSREPEIRTVTADAQSFELGQRFGLVIAPMQTVQLLDDPAAFMAAARRHLSPGGLIAVALATEMEPFDGADLDPDGLQEDDWTYLSTPVALRDRGAFVEIERRREAIGPRGKAIAHDVTRLARMTPEDLGRPEEVRRIAETPEHVATEVVLIRG
jgi:SAM-dependent methyltransferase